MASFSWKKERLFFISQSLKFTYSCWLSNQLLFSLIYLSWKTGLSHLINSINILRKLSKGICFKIAKRVILWALFYVIDFFMYQSLEFTYSCCLADKLPFSLLYLSKVIYPKYSKHLPYTVAHTIDWLCSKILNHGLNHG